MIITVESYRENPEHKATGDAVRDAYGLTWVSLMEFEPGEVVVHRYLSDANGKRYLVGEGDDREVASTVERYPWPVEA